MRDLLPADMARFRWAEAAFRETCLAWGYEEVRTPVLEYLHLFTATGTLTPQMLHRVYSFLDWDGWSGERVVLRPDGTIPAARLFIQEMKGQGARLFYVQDVFSFEESGQEPRERWQGGVELLGGPPPGAEAELVMLGREVLARLGLGPVEVRLAHLGLLRALVRELGWEEVVVDRLRNGEGWQALSASRPEWEGPLSLLRGGQGHSPSYLRNLATVLAPRLPPLAQPLKEFITLAQLLTDLGCEYTIDMTLSRGFEYYTGPVFHFYCRGVRVGGGGRYDDLIPLLGGPPTPASGFALYLERLMPLLEVPPGPGRVGVWVAEPGLWPTAFALARELRAAGFIISLGIGNGEQGVRVEAGPTFTLRWRGQERRLSSAQAVLQGLREGGDAPAGPA